MTRDEMMGRMSGQEYAAWGALFNVKAEEAEHERDIAESGDGVVIVSGLDRDDEPDDDDEDDEGPEPDGDEFGA